MRSDLDPAALRKLVSDAETARIAKLGGGDQARRGCRARRPPGPGRDEGGRRGDSVPRHRLVGARQVPQRHRHRVGPKGERVRVCGHRRGNPRSARAVRGF